MKKKSQPLGGLEGVKRRGSRIYRKSAGSRANREGCMKRFSQQGGDGVQAYFAPGALTFSSFGSFGSSAYFST
jgi:hypothetical protein